MSSSCPARPPPPPTSRASPTTGGRRWRPPPPASTAATATAAGPATTASAPRWRRRAAARRGPRRDRAGRRRGRRRALRARRADGAVAADERAAGAVSRGDRRLPRRRPGPDDRLRGRVGAAAPGPVSPTTATAILRPARRPPARPRAARRLAGRRRGAARDGRRLGRSRRHELSAVRRPRSPADDVQHARVRPRPGRHRPGTRRPRRRGDQPARARSGRGRSRPRAGSITAAPLRPPAPAFEPAETGTTPGDAVRLAIGGHATCLDRCTGGSGQGLTPDVHVGAAITRVKSMVAAGDGPAALLFGGGRASRGGEALDEGGARRYRELTQGTGVPTYVLPGPGDTAGGGEAAFARAFADAAAPQGTGAAAEGVDAAAVTQPESARRAPGASSRSTCAPRPARCASSRSTTRPAAWPAGRTDRRRSGCATSWPPRASAASPWSSSAAPRWTARSACRVPTTPTSSSRCSPATRRRTWRRPGSTIRSIRTSAA